MTISLLPVFLLAACTGTPDAPPTASPAPPAEPEPVDVTGWEGFFEWSRVEQPWLEERRLPFDALPIRLASARVGKLVIAGGAREAPEDELEDMRNAACLFDANRAWNEDRCRGLEERVCEDGTCRYEHFGNCSGLLAGDGWFITAAHCTAGLEADVSLAQASAILVPGADGRPAKRLELLSIKAGKHDWDHHWVALDDADPVDVAAVRVDDGALAPFPRAPLPAVGEPLFILGYPRVHGRTLDVLEAEDYRLVAGTPTVSFGRLADDNPSDAPLCNPDGNQEHWALISTCPRGTVGEGDEQSWTGPISNSPFLATYDSCNGYSGAPVFDAAGRWVGVNYTLASDTNPQDAFVEHARMVATPVDKAIQRLDIPLGGQSE